MVKNARFRGRYVVGVLPERANRDRHTSIGLSVAASLGIFVCLIGDDALARAGSGGVRWSRNGLERACGKPSWHHVISRPIRPSIIAGGWRLHSGRRSRSRVLRALVVPGDICRRSAHRPLPCLRCLPQQLFKDSYVAVVAVLGSTHLNLVIGRRIVFLACSGCAWGSRSLRHRQVHEGASGLRQSSSRISTVPITS